MGAGSVCQGGSIYHIGDLNGGARRDVKEILPHMFHNRRGLVYNIGKTRITEGNKNGKVEVQGLRLHS